MCDFFFQLWNYPELGTWHLQLHRKVTQQLHSQIYPNKPPTHCETFRSRPEVLSMFFASSYNQKDWSWVFFSACTQPNCYSFTLFSLLSLLIYWNFLTLFSQKGSLLKHCVNMTRSVLYKKLDKSSDYFCWCFNVFFFFLSFSE